MGQTGTAVIMEESLQVTVSLNLNYGARVVCSPPARTALLRRKGR